MGLSLLLKNHTFVRKLIRKRAILLTYLVFLVGLSACWQNAWSKLGKVLQLTAGYCPESNNFANTFGKLGVKRKLVPQNVTEVQHRRSTTFKMSQTREQGYRARNAEVSLLFSLGC